MLEIVSTFFFLIITALRVLRWIVLAYVILSWIPIPLVKVRQFIAVIVGPMLQWVRKYSPRFGMLDLSALFLWIVIDLAAAVTTIIAQEVVDFLR